MGRCFRNGTNFYLALDGLKSRDSCKLSFIRHNVLTVPCMYLYVCLNYVHNNLSLFTKNSQYHNYSTRNRDCLQTPLHRLKVTQQAIDFEGPKFYNKLSSEVRALPAKPFATKIKTYLLEQSFYKTQEYLESDVVVL